MLSSSLSVGDVIEIKSRLFGKVKLEIKKVGGMLCAVSTNGDVKMAVSALTMTSRAHSIHSIWSYVGKSEAITSQYVEYEEVGHVKDNIQENFLNNY